MRVARDLVVPTMSCRWLTCGLLAIAAFVLGCAATHPRARASAGVSALTEPDSLPPAAMYRTLCSQCHGAELKGYAADRAPSLANPTFLESATNFYLHRSI